MIASILPSISPGTLLAGGVTAAAASLWLLLPRGRGAKVTREFLWSMKRENGSDTTVTDAAGRFTLPEISRRSLMAMFPHEAVVRQSITIAIDGNSYKAWAYFKRNYDDNGELRRPIRLKCRLETEPASRPASYGEVFGVCDLD